MKDFADNRQWGLPGGCPGSNDRLATYSENVTSPTIIGRYPINVFVTYVNWSSLLGRVADKHTKTMAGMLPKTKTT